MSGFGQVYGGLLSKTRQGDLTLLSDNAAEAVIKLQDPAGHIIQVC